MTVKIFYQVEELGEELYEGVINSFDDIQFFRTFSSISRDK